jgi:hypothetical protein
MAIRAVLCGVLGFISVILLMMLRPYRTDITSRQGFTEGKSRTTWQLNAWNPRNYEPRARKLLGLHLACFAAFAFLLWSLAFSSL